MMDQAWLVLGSVIFMIGFGALAFSRRTGAGSLRLPVLGSVSRTSALTLGLSLMFGGYHIVAYLGPSGIVSLFVRPDLWWLVAAGCVIAVAGAFAGDRLLAEDSDAEGEIQTFETEELGGSDERR